MDLLLQTLSDPYLRQTLGGLAVGLGIAAGTHLLKAYGKRSDKSGRRKRRSARKN